MVTRRRWSILNGFWAFLVGGVGLASTLLVLDPVTRVEDCPNYGAAGNASAFADPNWNGYLPLLLLAWFTAVVVEQALPVTSRDRRGYDVAARATAAILLTVLASCWCLGLLLVCN